MKSLNDQELQPETLTFEVTGVGNIPSFKNKKRIRVDRKTLKPYSFTEPMVKKRMLALEDAIVYELFSLCQETANETHSECSKRLRTLLSGLCDDSIREIPCGSWEVEYCEKGTEGVRITIERQ